jgi:DNA-directed RNA polymerase sigma subunit (sigma70/sigma32)
MEKSVMTIEQVEDREYLNLLFYYMPTASLKILRARYVLEYSAREVCENADELGLAHYKLTQNRVYSMEKRAIKRLSMLNNNYQTSKEFNYE